MKGNKMEQCPKCKHMSAERNHYTKLLICYNRNCDYKEKKIKNICHFDILNLVRQIIGELYESDNEYLLDK